MTQVVAVKLESGADILKNYSKGHPDAVFKYKQICNVLLSFGSWSEKSKNDFFEQFINCAHAFIQPTELLVERLCNLSWSSIPAAVLPKFVTLLQEIAVFHVYHTKVVVHQLFTVLLPLVDPNAAEIKENANPNDSIPILIQPEVTAEQQRLFTALSREAIVTILSRLQTSHAAVVQISFKKFPHYSGPSFKFTEYIKQLILIAEACPDIAQELWVKIIDHILQIDAIISKSISNNAKFDAGDSLFALEEEDMTLDSPLRQREIDLTNKLDKAMIIIFSRIGLGKMDFSKIAPEEDFSWLEHLPKGSDSCIFEQLWPAFMEQMLNAHDVQSVSFIWFFACNLEEKYQNFMLKMLWNLVTYPIYAPNEQKRAHTAAAFLGGFLARAMYINFKTCTDWLKKMADWCNDYIAKSGLCRNGAGCIQHGTFYAVVQSLLFVFSFRYKEFVENNCINDIHAWGLSRIVHSHFEPLKYISRVIAMGFSTISRSLQLVYCCHILDSSVILSTPIEHYLPFSFLQLPITSSIISPLLRKFEPTNEDAGKIQKNMMEVDPRKQTLVSNEDEDDYGFMDDDDVMMSESDPLPTVEAALSSSPFSINKLRHQ